MRTIAAILASLLVLLAGGRPSVASCAPPATVADNAARAEAVVYGAVINEEQGSVTIRVDKVLKGSVPQTLSVFVGPGRPSGAGQGVFTSVDYEAKLGSDHVFYLIRGADGQLETNACIGSHAGRPTHAESAYFAPAASPEASASDPAGQAGPAEASAAPVGVEVPPTSTPSPALLGVFGLALLAALAIAGALGRRLLTRSS